MNPIEQLQVNGSHYQVGVAIGRRFGDQIHRFYANYGFLQERLLPFHRSLEGQDLFHAFLKLHQTHFGATVAELEGMAQGAERPFEELLLVNLRGEYEGLLAPSRPADGCTDYLVLTPDAALIGHNEDGAFALMGNVYVVHAQVDDNPAFTALCYPGFLPGNAFGFNAAGVMHTADAVSPRRVRVGLGRQFIARSVLDAVSLDDAIRRTTVTGRAAGFTYNIGSLAERRLVSVEVAPEHHHVRAVAGHYVHTNHYLHLKQVEQTIGPSSRSRMDRAQTLGRAMPPTDAAHVLAVLGDEVGRDYPIYRRAAPPDSSATVCTALYDLDARQLRIYTGHPVREPEQYLVLDL